MSWTEERVALLKQLWGEGKSAAEIARELGGGVTRNAVIGKAHRLKLSGRISPIQQNAKPEGAAKETDSASSPVSGRKSAGRSSGAGMSRNTAKSQAVREAREKVQIPAPEIRGVQMADLRERMCRWPVGDPKDKGFCFCGNDAPMGMAYCAHHSRIAYQASIRGQVQMPQQPDEHPAVAADDAAEMPIRKLARR